MPLSYALMPLCPYAPTPGDNAVDQEGFLRQDGESDRQESEKELRMTLILAMETILEMGLPDRAVDAEALPWVPQGDRVWFKPLRFDLTNGRWVNLLKITGGGKVNRHRHSGGQVLGY